MDISGFFNVYLSGVLNVAKKYYDTLDSITFGGISVLDYAITLLILSVVVPMVITLTKSGVRSASRSYRERSRERREGSSDV